MFVNGASDHGAASTVIGGELRGSEFYGSMGLFAGASQQTRRKRSRR